MTFTHGGAAGDIIYHLAPLKSLGGASLWLNRAVAVHWSGGAPAGLARMESLLTLLRVQPCLRDCGLTNTICLGVAKAVAERFSSNQVERSAPWQVRIQKPYR